LHQHHASALLSAIANKIIPGIADNLRILLVNQIDDSDMKPTFLLTGEDVVGGADLTVIERVVKSDRVKETALAEYQCQFMATLSCVFATELHITSNPHTALSQALESLNTSDLSESLARIKLCRSQKHLEDAKKMALRRSGARGSEARKALLRAEARLKEDEER
jgi:ATP-binding cassette, subfamily F, member 3